MSFGSGTVCKFVKYTRQKQVAVESRFLAMCDFSGFELARQLMQITLYSKDGPALCPK